MAAAIELKGVVVKLGGEIIFQNVNLQINHGDMMVIIGPSGAGKTVLLKTMAGVILPSAGQVFCEGEEWQNLQSEKKRKLAQKIGVQFQKGGLFDSFSVFENVAFPLREHHPEYTNEQIAEMVRACLEAVDLIAAKDRLPHEISGGMQLRLGIARAVVMNPEIVFYDDVNAGLDPVNSDRIVDLVLRLKQKNESTVVVVTNDLRTAYRLAGRIVLVGNKEVIETGNAEETKNSKNPCVRQFLEGRREGPLHWG
ncbi:MAG: ABC transporter ATP-binding protein [Bdellovibrionales bacterium RBG_16_40_8]|nr:MAG: ABC transporter ATP-binding protein [Bdellovibrionales bacterium RBG_16_40_8]